MKKVIVTGSHGFIGSNLVSALEKAGTEVYKFDLKIDRDCLKGDINPNGDAEAIFHLACTNQMDAVANPDENIQNNAFAAQILSWEANFYNIPLIYTSTASVYGNATKLPTPVWHPPNPQSDYAAAKLCGEHFIKNSGCDYRIFRLSNVYGPGQTVDNPYCGVVAKFFDSALKSEPMRVIGDGTQTRDFTYVDDVVNTLLDEDLPLNQTFNVSYGREISILKLAKLIAQQAGGWWEVGAPERPVDGIKRRLLLPDVVCPTKMSQGISHTFKAL